MTVEPMTDAELDGLRSKIFAYNRKERSRLRLFGQDVIRILARLDAERTRADALEAENAALKARNAALEDGLRPFAKLGELFPPAVHPGGYDEGIYCPAAGPEYAIGGNDLRRARALLQGGHDAG